ncbi:MAG: hypothetical protein FWE69_05700 [Clostridiales bacterium]|nr:hypothetical protein [Clostridiales bacterium]
MGKTIFTKVLGAILVVMLLATSFSIAPKETQAAPNEYAMFPFSILKVNRTNAALDPDQRSATGGGHGKNGGWAWDLGGSDKAVKAPFTGKIINNVDTSTHAVILQSVDPVYFANGHVGHMSLLLVHDEKYPRFANGTIVNQGDTIYYQGGYGKNKPGYYAVHLHIEAAYGQRTTIKGIRDNKLQLNDALYLNKSTVRQKDYINVQSVKPNYTITPTWRIAPDNAVQKPTRPNTVTVSKREIAAGEPQKITWSSVSNAAGYSYQLVCTSNSSLTQTKASTTAANVTVTTKAPSKDETYRLRVWSKNSAGESDTYRESDPITVYAPRTVTYLNFDNKQIDKKTVDWGTNATPPKVPEREGYNFNRFEPYGADLNVKANQTLTATYQKKSFTVKFFDISGSQIGATQNVLFENAATPPPPPTETGWTFVKWDTEDYKSVKKNLEVHASYQWSNFEIPIQTTINTATRAADSSSYTVNVTLKNNHATKAKQGRILVAIKTSAGKLVDSTIVPFAAIAPGGTRTENVAVLTQGLGFYAEVSVIGIQGDGNTSAPLSETKSKEIDLGDPWSGWSRETPPASAIDTQSAIEYRTRTKSTTTSSSSTMSGWTLVNTTYTLSAWGSWSAWRLQSIAKYTASETREVQTATLYRYY